MFWKYKISIPIDSPERTVLHREIIMRKKFLRKLYEQWYEFFLSGIEKLPDGKILELGSGGGFLKDLEPSVITSDLLRISTNDMTFSALDMPFEDKSVAAIFMIDTLHHIPDMEKFFTEATRILVSGGKIMMIEPSNTRWGHFIYTRFHHEPFDPGGGWKIPESGPLSGANGALPWIVFSRDREKFKSLFPLLKIENISFCNPILYLFSGGLSYRQILPDFMYPAVAAIDRLLIKLSTEMGMFQAISLVKKEKKNHIPG